MPVNDDGSVDFDPAGWAAAAESALHQAMLVEPGSPKHDHLITEAQTGALVSIAQSLTAIASTLQGRE